MRILKAILIGLFATGITGCAINRDIRIQSEPSGASVYASSKLLGQTPFITDIDALFPNRAYDFQPSASRTLVFKKSGFQDATVTVGEFSVPPVIQLRLTPLSGQEVESGEENEKRLKDLKRLREQGLISEEEFQRKRKAIIDKL